MVGHNTGNFGFLAAYDPLLAKLPALAERYFTDDPNTCLIKLRQFAECLAKETAAKASIEAAETDTLADILRRLRDERYVDRRVSDLFHSLRRLGNDAAHDHGGTHAEARSSLRQSDHWHGSRPSQLELSPFGQKT